MRNNRDIVFIGGVNWKADVVLPAHHVVRELAQNHRVFYIDSFGAGRPITLGDTSQVLRKAKSLVSRTSGESNLSNIRIHQPVLIPFPQSQLVSKANGLMLAWSLQRMMKKYEIDRPIVWTRVRTETVASMLNHIEYSALVLQVVDNGPYSPHIPVWLRSRLVDADKRLTQRADVVFVSAEGLLSSRTSLNQNTHFIPNGVSSSMLSNQSLVRPSLLDGAPDPVVVFGGSIGPWVNLEFLLAAAQALPSVTFLILGPHRTDLNTLKNLSNLFLPGSVPYSELGSYFRSSAVGIIPYHLDEFTKYTFPSKFFEYLGCGLEVVSSRLPELMSFENFVYFADTPAEFVSAISRALKTKLSGKNTSRNIEFAAKHDWPSLVARMDQLVSSALRPNQR